MWAALWFSSSLFWRSWAFSVLTRALPTSLTRRVARLRPRTNTPRSLSTTSPTPGNVAPTWERTTHNPRCVPTWSQRVSGQLQVVAAYSALRHLRGTKDRSQKVSGRASSLSRSVPLSLSSSSSPSVSDGSSLSSSVQFLFC